MKVAQGNWPCISLLGTRSASIPFQALLEQADVLRVSGLTG